MIVTQEEVHKPSGHRGANIVLTVEESMVLLFLHISVDIAFAYMYAKSICFLTIACVPHSVLYMLEAF